MMQRFFFGNSAGSGCCFRCWGDDEGWTPEELQRLKDAIAAAADDTRGGRPMTAINLVMGYGLSCMASRLCRDWLAKLVRGPGLWQGIVVGRRAWRFGLRLVAGGQTAAVRFRDLDGLYLRFLAGAAAAACLFFEFQLAVRLAVEP